MRILDLKDNKIIITPEAIGLKFLGDLWVRDSSQSKSKAINDISYVYYFSDFSSPYFQYPENDRDSHIKEYVVGNTYKPDSKVKVAIEAYIELNTTPGMRLLQAAYISVTQTEKYLKNVDYTVMDDNGRFLYDITKVSNMIINLPKLQEALNQAKDICLKEQSSTTKVRGGKDVSLFED